MSRHLVLVRSVTVAVVIVAASAASAASAAGTNVTFTGLVLNTCVLNLSTPGLLGTGASGTLLSSEEVGGAPAVVAVIATGTAPTLNFSAPTMTGPSGWSGSPSVAVRYNSLGGATQTYTTDASVARASQLLDTFTVHARASNAAGFASGSYTLATTVTCQQ